MNLAYRRGILFLCAVLVAFGSFLPAGWSYEVRTHADISREAYRLANIDGFLVQELGLSGKRILGMDHFERPRTPDEWLQEGSIDEDSFVHSLRFFNHFYDPIFNRGLDTTVRVVLGAPVLLQGQRSDEWGLEDPQELVGQDFSYRDAREHFRLSLTEADPKVRERRLADTFYALGHVIHLIQDLASPPHTRNAPHGGLIGGLFDGGPPSVVEKYLDLDGVRQGLKFDGYPIPKVGFTKPRDFWVETDASGAPSNGPDARGLSQIINRNFVSEGTNFTAFVDGSHAPEYPDPVLNTADCFEESVTTQDAEENVISGLVTFCRNSFLDPNTGILETNHRMTTFSLFSQDLQELGAFVAQMSSLNALNAVSIGELTIPRAVGYSAGLLDYFFRGRLDLATDPSQTELRVTNRSDEAIGPGTLSVYCDDANGNRVKLDELTVSQEVQADAEFPRIPFSPPAATVRCVVVYEGELGEEADVVIGKVFQLGIRPVARTGDAVPGGGTFGTFFFGRPAVNEAGAIVFNGVFADNQTEAIFLESQGQLQPPLVLTGDTAPGGGTFGFFGSLGLDDQGTVAFWGAVGSPSNFTSGIFLAPPGGQLEALALPGDPATGSCGTTFTDFLFDSVGLNNQREVAFIGDFLSSAVPSCFDGLFIVAGGTIRKVAQQSDPVPGGGRFHPFFSDMTTTLNDAGEVAFAATVSGSTAPVGIFLGDGRVVLSLVRSGDPAPGGGSFTSVRDPSLNDAGAVAFRGMLGSSTEGIFLRSSTGQLTAVARTDDPAPRGGLFRNFGHPAMNNLGVIVFTARLDDLSEGLFRFANGIIATLARTGDFPLGGGTFDRFSGLSSTEGPAINDVGQVVFHSILADGRRGVFVVEPTTLPTQIP
ncbi:MAG: choice-of-anchor tandem repeat NxxGxxAF-containing protein [candidate division NC10 bacterium]